MFKVISFMFAGVFLGYTFRQFHFLRKTEKTITLTILSLLFLFGLNIGSNQAMIQNFGSFGWQAFILAFASLFGSVLASCIVYHLFFKKGGHHEK